MDSSQHSAFDRGLNSLRHSAPQAYAHYFASKSGKAVIINQNIQPVGGTTYPVRDKHEARKLAAEHNAKCWNF